MRLDDIPVCFVYRLHSFPNHRKIFPGSLIRTDLNQISPTDCVFSKADSTRTFLKHSSATQEREPLAPFMQQILIVTINRKIPFEKAGLFLASRHGEGDCSFLEAGVPFFESDPGSVLLGSSGDLVLLPIGTGFATGVNPSFSMTCRLTSRSSEISY